MPLPPRLQFRRTGVEPTLGVGGPAISQIMMGIRPAAETAEIEVALGGGEAPCGFVGREKEVLHLWGILGALIMRGIFIATGITLIHKFHWIIYLFGAFLIITGIRISRQKDKEIHPERNPVLRLFRRWMPVSDCYEGGKFFTKKKG